MKRAISFLLQFFPGIIITIVISCILTTPGSSQLKDSVKEKYQSLKVGDKVPNYTFNNLVNYPAKTVSISDFKGKLLILDFWSTGCASCIESWPKLEKLQSEFGDKIQILLVNPWQSQNEVRTVIERRKVAGFVNLTLPSVCNDKSILQLFPLKGVPHVVWIDKNGIIKSITYSDVLNEKNIREILLGNDVEMHQKINSELEVDYFKPLFISGNAGNGKNLLWQSVLSKYVEEISGTLGLYANSKLGYSIFVVNQSVMELYRFAYSDRLDMHEKNLSRLPLNRIRLNVDDTTRYVDQINGETQYDNLYVYQLTSTIPTTRENLQRMMQEDLKRYFGLKVRWEKKKMNCLVLTASDTSLFQFNGGEWAVNASDSEFHFNAVTISFIIKYLEDVTRYYFSPYPFIDETRYKGKVGELKFVTNVTDYKALDKSLTKYGLRLQLKEREVQVLVLEDGSEPPLIDNN